jgi:reductive dehalogenase
MRIISQLAGVDILAGQNYIQTLEVEMRHEVDSPTYEVVGPLKRFDERDTVFAREALQPGSREEKEYHQLHPELVEIDRRLARFIQEKIDNPPQVPEDPLNEAFYDTTFGAVAALAQPDSVDGPVNSYQVEVDPEVMSRRIKAVATRLGADLVRIAKLNPAWVYSHRGARPFFEEYRANPPLFPGAPEGYQGLRYGDPMEIHHQYAISMGFAQDLGLVRTGPSLLNDFETGRVYALSALVAVELARYIRGLGYAARAHHLRNYGVMMVPVAVDAGMGELARCGYLVTKELGANLRLVCVTTDLPLAADRPVDLGVQDYCEKCLKCAENCPPRAIPFGDKVEVRGVKKWEIDEVKCLLYWGSQGAACGICQVVCPWSKPRTLFHRFVAEVATSVPWSRRFLTKADDWVYGARYQPQPIPDWAREGRSPP